MGLRSRLQNTSGMKSTGSIAVLFERPANIRALLLRGGAVPMIAASVVACFLFWLLWGSVRERDLIVWFAAIMSVNFVRLLLIRVTVSRIKSDEDAVLYWFAALTFVAGMVWGAAGMFLVPAEPLELRVILSFCLGGLVAGTVASYSHWLPVFFAFALPTMLPIAIQFLAGDRDIDKLMGVLLIVYTASLTLLAVNFNRTLRQSMSLRETLGGVELLMESIFIHLPFPVAVKSPESRYILVNERFAERRKLSAEEIVDKDPEEIFEAETAVLIRKYDRRVVESKSSEIIENRILGADGVLRDYLSIKYPVIDEVGEVHSIVSLDVDITERKRTELALQQSKEAAELANRTKTEFLTNMSHELRTPLNSIIGFSDVLQTAALGPISPKYREYASDINSSGGHLLALISDILDVSKIEAGEIEIDEEVFDLSSLIAETLRMVRDRAERKGLELNEISSGKIFLIRADPLRLKQVLLNVLTNAIKFTPEGGQIDLTTGCEDAGGDIVISVQDTGIGINAIDLPRVVQPFVQVSNPSIRNAEGTGLGLTLAKAFIEMHDGTLSIESEPGAGTKVSILLPAQRHIP